MKKFNEDNFMLDSQIAVRLYKNYADIKVVPIIDYHCHIPVSEIKEDRHFNNLTELWLGADHYKWRQMRMSGIPEKYITGEGDDYEKFEAFASIMPSLIGNPLYHWSHMELKYYFGIEEPLSKKNARKIWEVCNEKLSGSGFGARDLIKASNVALLCTTDDPIDNLKDHEALKEDASFKTKVLPAFRPDNAIDIEKKEWAPYIAELSKAADLEIIDADSLVKALYRRIDYFDKRGCRTSDHGLYAVEYVECLKEEADIIVSKALNQETLTTEEISKYKNYILSRLAAAYKEKGWVMQLHYGVVRNVNTAAYESLGINTGFDCMHDDTNPVSLIKFLDSLNRTAALPKTVLYSLNPGDNALIDCITGAFYEEGVRGKVTHGSAWWFNDHQFGMENQLKSFASLNTLGNHIGMLTDSRSLVSYTRHDYFRRILCNLIGEWVEKGYYPDDEEALEKLIKDISFNNTAEYFGFDI